MNTHERIIWSADVVGRDVLSGHIEEMLGLKQVKLDRLFLEREGRDVIAEVEDRGVWVFVDAKIVEISSKVVELAKLYLQYRPWMLNCMAGVVSTGLLHPSTREEEDQIDALKRFADTCRAVGTRPCAVTVLTSKTPEVVSAEFNGRTPIDQVLYYVERLLEAGFTDVVCSPQEDVAIRKESRFSVLHLNNPGIQPEGVSQYDQARTDTPTGAFKAGATRIIVGRALTRGNPAGNYMRLAAEVETAIARGYSA